MFSGLSMVIDMPTVTISLPAMTDAGAGPAGLASGFCSAGLGCAGVIGLGSIHQDACTSAPAQTAANQAPEN
jgi:hypothetical protein